MFHAYSNVKVIKRGTYTRALLRGRPKPKSEKLKTPGCVSVCSIAHGTRKHLRPPREGPSYVEGDVNHEDVGEAAVKRTRPY